MTPKGRRLAKARHALNHLTRSRPQDTDGYVPYYDPPKKLQRERDNLKENFAIIWIQCLISYDDDERGASIAVSRRDIKIGPFFLQKRFTSLDLEKIILHEYLHAALDVESQFHHSFMEQIIKYNLKYQGAWNPAEGLI